MIRAELAETFGLRFKDIYIYIHGLCDFANFMASLWRYGCCIEKVCCTALSVLSHMIYHTWKKLFSNSDSFSPFDVIGLCRCEHSNNTSVWAKTTTPRFNLTQLPCVCCKFELNAFLYPYMLCTLGYGRVLQRSKQRSTLACNKLRNQCKILQYILPGSTFPRHMWPETSVIKL